MLECQLPAVASPVAFSQGQVVMGGHGWIMGGSWVGRRPLRPRRARFSSSCESEAFCLVAGAVIGGPWVGWVVMGGGGGGSLPAAFSQGKGCDCFCLVAGVMGGGHERVVVHHCFVAGPGSVVR